MELPLSDPQFWLVSLGAVAALAIVVRRLRRRGRGEAGPTCDRCPQPRGPRRIGALVLALLGAADAARAASVERQVAAMGTTLRVEVETTGGRAGALALAEAMVRAVEATESRLSTWRAGSELARLNRTPVGEWIESPASDELAAAGDCAQATELAFHPAVGHLVAAWGLRDGGRVPSSAEIAAARRGLDGLGFEARSAPRRVRRTADVALDEGAFGKGAGLDAALATVEGRDAAAGPVSVRLVLGGQLAWSNAARPQVVDLADPRDRARAVLELTLDAPRASLAVSGNSEQRFDREGSSFGHLLDPRTGRPAPDFGAVAVVAPEGLRADCLSTALFVMGPDEGARWLAARQEEIGAAFLVVDGERLRARLTPALARRARPLVAELEIEELLGTS